jgi:two-component system alkaline phosphatase synthesis response regulator PhoP
MHKLLLLEDEQNIGATLSDLLEGAGYAVTWAQTCAEARDALKLYPFDVALLDVNLPDGTGFQVAELLQSSPTVMLFLTAMSDPEHRVQGLQLGAEDYIVKPFHLQELLLRIRNALKRPKPLTARVQLGDALIDFSTFTFTRNGQSEILSAKEAKLLQLLCDRRGKVVSRDEILNHVWPLEAFPTARTVDNFILKLRKLVGDESIKTIRGIGYQLIEEII